MLCCDSSQLDEDDELELELSYVLVYCLITICFVVGWFCF